MKKDQLRSMGLILFYSVKNYGNVDFGADTTYSCLIEDKNMLLKFKSVIFFVEVKMVFIILVSLPNLRYTNLAKIFAKDDDELCVNSFTIIEILMKNHCFN